MTRAAILTNLEEKMADLEDRSRRNNVCIMNPQILGSLPVWFPSLAEAKPEIMRAHRKGPLKKSGRPRTVIMKMLHYTDHDSILRSSRKSPIKVDCKDIRFAEDNSMFTIN